jgi:diguanylate cyclase (GGDEF)-like protein
MNSETTATPVHRGLFADLRDRLAQRPDTEHQAALIRIVIALIAGCYLLITVYRTDSLFSDVQWHVIALVCFFIPFSIGIFISILVGPQISVARRILSMFMDIAATTYALYFLDAAGTAVFGVYLFNACGNGFRFGPKYLYLSSALSIVGFTFVLATSEYWASHLTLGIGLLLVLLVIPMYFASLSRQLHDALARMHTMATHDTLTGLPNRHSFYEQLQQTLKLAERSRSSFAVVFIDLDGFKPINDSLGHAAGDEVLKSVARRLKQSVRSDDVVARIGGDEFVIILSIIEATGLLPVVRKIINIIATPYTVSGKTITLTSSTGVATYPDSGRTVDKLVACADTAMYRSKRNGRNCFCLDRDTQPVNILPSLCK